MRTKPAVTSGQDQRVRRLFSHFPVNLQLKAIREQPLERDEAVGLGGRPLASRQRGFDVEQVHVQPARSAHYFFASAHLFDAVRARYEPLRWPEAEESFGAAKYASERPLAEQFSFSWLDGRDLECGTSWLGLFLRP